MMGESRAKQLELSVLMKSKRRFMGSDSSSSSPSLEGIRIATEEVMESSSESSSPKGSHQDSLEASYESEDSFTVEAKGLIEATNLGASEKKKLQVVQGRIKKMSELPSYTKSQ
mmetsp:Transcript_28812/g.43501  ORF Transcript_28812/g.43501 Transcript_28812/m.43501 type:complete len:114 (+) Transcript_28812:2291-2632(+)